MILTSTLALCLFVAEVIAQVNFNPRSNPGNAFGGPQQNQGPFQPIPNQLQSPVQGNLPAMPGQPFQQNHGMQFPPSGNVNPQRPWPQQEPFQGEGTPLVALTSQSKALPAGATHTFGFQAQQNGQFHLTVSACSGAVDWSVNTPDGNLAYQFNAMEAHQQELQQQQQELQNQLPIPAQPSMAILPNAGRRRRQAGGAPWNGGLQPGPQPGALPGRQPSLFPPNQGVPQAPNFGAPRLNNPNRAFPAPGASQSNHGAPQSLPFGPAINDPLVDPLTPGAPGAGVAANLPGGLGRGNQFRMPASVITGPRPRPMPVAFDPDMVDFNREIGLGTSLLRSTSSWTEENADGGNYLVTVSNPLQTDASFSIVLIPQPARTTYPQVPQNDLLRVEWVRPNEIGVAWHPVQGMPPMAGSGQIQYCLQAMPARAQGPGVTHGSICSAHRRSMNLRTICTHDIRATIPQLQSDTRYYINLYARNMAARQEVAYVGSNVSTSPEGVALPNNREISDYLLQPRHLQVFTFDTTRSVHPTIPVSVTVFPCKGLVTWSVTRDGIPVSYFEPEFMDSEFDIEDRFAGGGFDDDDHGPETMDAHDYEQGSDFRPRPAPVIPRQPISNFPRLASNPRGKRQINHVYFHRPVAAGFGRSAGRSVFSYEDMNAQRHVYQVIVYNTGETMGRFNIFATISPNNAPYPRLPLNRQVSVTDSSPRHITVAWHPSPSPGVQYCVISRPQSRIPLVGWATQIPSTPCSVRSEQAAQSMLRSGICKSEPYRTLSNVTRFGRYRIDVLALSPQSMQAMSYTSVLAYARPTRSGSSTSNPPAIFLFVALLAAVMSLFP